MAKPISDEELQLRNRARRRLIGAIVIVTAVVVALPMVLDNEPKPEAQAPAATAEAKPEPGAELKPQPSAESKPRTEDSSTQAAAPKPEKPASAAKAEQPAPKPASAQSGRYVVQVVALSDARKAKQMQQAILKSGVKAYTEVVKTARGDVTRVRAGPYTTREAAEKAQQKLKGAGFDGKVIPAR